MIKIIKFIFKIAVVLLGVTAILFLGIYLIYNSDLPKGITGEKANNLAYKISSSIGYEAYQHTDFISWDVREYAYRWDKVNKIVVVEWDNNYVLYNQDEPHNSVVAKPTNCSDTIKKQLIAKAESKFNNDSFWLVAPFKFFDTGVERVYIEATENENASLLITYKSGGTTPGDSYQWFVDENFMPTHFKMWVQIIPIGGLPATWANWKKMNTGIKLSHEKKILNSIPFPISNIKAWNN